MKGEELIAEVERLFAERDRTENMSYADFIDRSIDKLLRARWGDTIAPALRALESRSEREGK